MSETKLDTFKYEDKNGNVYTVEGGGAKSYDITTTLTGVSVVGGSKIVENSITGLVISPTTGYTLSNDLSKFTISGASFLSWMSTYTNSTSKTLLIGNPTGNVELVLNGIPNTYNITYSLTNLTASTKPTTIEYDGGASIKLASNTGYNLPSSITVTNATKSYTQSTGALTLSKCTGAVTITAAGVLKTYTITKSISYGSSSGASSISHGGSATVTITPNSGYLVPTSVTVSGATYNYDSTTGVVSLSNATGNVTITATCPERPVVAKGDIISMDLGDTASTDGVLHQYRVLKNVSGSKYLVVAMYAPGSSEFGSSQTYANSTLDTYLNSTWYGGLSDTAKSAIVSQTIKQDSWYWGTSGSPVYSGYYGTTNPGTSSYSVSLGNASFGSSISRYVYALSVQDVIDYVTDTSIGDGLLQNYNIWKMFWNTTNQPSNISYPWLRSANARNSNSCWRVYGNDGSVYNYGSYSSSSAVRPAFTIDLSKIPYSIVE